MKVGTMPLTVQAPDRAPMSSRITIAFVTSPTLERMASSKAFQGVLYSHIDSHTHTPVATSRLTCEAPRMASLPKMLMSSDNSPTSTTSGISAMTMFLRACFSIQVCKIRIFQGMSYSSENSRYTKWAMMPAHRPAMVCAPRALEMALRHPRVSSIAVWVDK